MKMERLHRSLNFVIVWSLILLVFAIAAQVVLSELTDWQVYFITFVLAPILAEVYKFIVNTWGWKPGKFHVSVALSAISIVLAYFFGGDFFGSLPPIGDNFLLWIDGLLKAIAVLIGLAKIVYDLLWDRVFDRLASGWTLLSYRLEG